MHIFLIQRAIKYFYISTAAIDILFMLNSKLNNKRFVFIAEWLEFRAQGIESGILRCLDTCCKYEKLLYQLFY